MGLIIFSFILGTINFVEQSKQFHFNQQQIYLSYNLLLTFFTFNFLYYCGQNESILVGAHCLQPVSIIWPYQRRKDAFFFRLLVYSLLLSTVPANHTSRFLLSFYCSIGLALCGIVYLLVLSLCEMVHGVGRFVIH